MTENSDTFNRANKRTLTAQGSLQAFFGLQKAHTIEVDSVEVTHIYKVTNRELMHLFDTEVPSELRLQELANRHQGVEGLLRAVQSEALSGIMGDERDIYRRQTYFGENEKPAPQIPPFRESLRDALNDRILLILAVFALLSIISGMIYNPRNGWVEGVSIFVAIFLLVLITSVNDWKKDRKFVELQSLARDQPPPEIPDIEMLFTKSPSMAAVRPFLLPLGVNLKQCRPRYGRSGRIIFDRKDPITREAFSVDSDDEMDSDDDGNNPFLIRSAFAVAH